MEAETRAYGIAKTICDKGWIIDENSYLTDKNNNVVKGIIPKRLLGNIITTPIFTFEILPEDNLPYPTKMSFSQALEALKQGNAIKRSNISSIRYLYLEEHLSFTINSGIYKGISRKYYPIIVAYNDSGFHEPGWVPTQADMLENDWIITEYQ